MSSKVTLDGLGEIGRQAQALGPDATRAINSALLAGAKIIATEARQRVPRYKRHKATHGRSPKHLADVLKAEVITKRKVAGVTAPGGINGPSYYLKFVEHGTTRMKARKYVAKSAEAKETEVLGVVADTLKDKLGL